LVEHKVELGLDRLSPQLLGVGQQAVFNRELLCDDVHSLNLFHIVKLVDLSCVFQLFHHSMPDILSSGKGRDVTFKSIYFGKLLELLFSNKDHCNQEVAGWVHINEDLFNQGTV